MIARPGMLIRTRRARGEPWHYGSIAHLDENDVLHIVEDRGGRLLLALVDARWMFDNGNLETAEPRPDGRHPLARLLGR